MAESGRWDRITGGCGGEIVKLNIHMLPHTHSHTSGINGGECGDLQENRSGEYVLTP